MCNIKATFIQVFWQPFSLLTVGRTMVFNNVMFSDVSVHFMENFSAGDVGVIVLISMTTRLQICGSSSSKVVVGNDVLTQKRF